jgi:2-iminobutanoate/2-iminopropanoate deaminase
VRSFEPIEKKRSWTVYMAGSPTLGNMTLKREIVSARTIATLPGAPYSPAVKIGDLIFTAGQVPDDSQADMKTQTRQALDKIKALLEAAGSSLNSVVKCTVYITNMDEFASMNEAYGEYFKEKPPARTTVQVSRLARNARIEIDAIAAVP